IGLPALCSWRGPVIDDGVVDRDSIPITSPGAAPESAFSHPVCARCAAVDPTYVRALLARGMANGADDGLILQVARNVGGTARVRERPRNTPTVISHIRGAVDEDSICAHRTREHG